MRPSDPVAGWYQTRLVAGGPWVAARIWHGPPLDPLTGETLDRSLRWQATLRGEPYNGDVIALWQRCAKHPITQARHDYLVALMRHAVTHEPDLPDAAPRDRIDLNKLPPLY